MKHSKGALIGAIAIIFAASLWGLDGVVLTPRLYHLDVSIVVFLEHAVAFGLMMLFLAATLMFRPSFPASEFSELKRLGWKDWLSLFWIALFGGAIGTMAITKALFYVNFQDLSAIIILQKLQPLFAILLAVLLLRERPKREFYAWALLALIGSYFITFGFHSPVLSGNRMFVASMLSLLAAFSFGSSTVFGKKAVSMVNFRVATYVRFGLTALIMIPIIFATGSFPGFAQVTGSELLLVLLIAFTTGGLAIFIYYFGLRRVMASKSTIYELAFPVTAVALDYLVNGNVMTLGQLLGAVLVVGSVVRIAQLRNKGQASAA